MNLHYSFTILLPSIATKLSCFDMWKQLLSWFLKVGDDFHIYEGDLTPYGYGSILWWFNIVLCIQIQWVQPTTSFSWVNYFVLKQHSNILYAIKGLLEIIL